MAKIIRDAWQSGRQIVPIIGAGCSADAGVPTVGQLMSYIGNYRSYVDNAYYLPSRDEGETNSLLLKAHELAVARYRGKTGRFISEHGWIDRFDMLYALNRKARNSEALEKATNEAFANLANEMYPRAASRLGNLQAVDWKNRGSVSNFGRTVREILMDWRPLVRHFSNHQQEITESLFQSIHRNRNPNTFHRYLVHLTLLMRHRLIFTFNFDELIENAFTAENQVFQVFAMDHGSDLPPGPLLIPPSIIKLHGGNHNLLVDERVDYPLSKRYLDRFFELTGEHPLLIVAGCGGTERRLTDLVKECARRSISCGSDVSVIWVEFGMDKDECKLPAEIRQTSNIARLVSRDLGGLFGEIYVRLTSRFPGAATPYKASCDRIVPAVSNESQPLSNSAACFDEERATTILKNCLGNQGVPPVTFIDNTGANRDSSLLDSPNQWLIFNWLRRLPSSKTIVYLDLESYHSLADLVNGIFDQARQVDSALLPVLLSIGTDSSASEYKSSSASEQKSAVLDPDEICKRVVQALERNEIALVFDGIDAYEWKPLSHHGISRSEASAKSPEREDMRKFMDCLLNRFLDSASKGQSVICISADPVEYRHQLNDNKEDNSEAAKAYTELRETILRKQLCVIDVQKELGTSDVNSQLRYSGQRIPSRAVFGTDFDNETKRDLLIRAMAAMRRTRSLPLLHDVQKAVCNSYEDLVHDKLLDDLAKEGILLPLEGGFYAMSKFYRNRVYAEATKSMRTSSIRQILEKEATIKEATDYFNQALEISAIHCWLSGWYISEGFFTTGDSNFFFECIYHRVSAIRYLVDLILVLQSTQTDKTETYNKIVEQLRVRVARLYFPSNQSEGAIGTPIFQTCPVVSAFGRAKDLKELIDSLQVARARSVCGLSAIWRKAISQVRRSTSVHQIHPYCEALLDLDCIGKLSPPMRLASIVESKTSETSSVSPDSQTVADFDDLIELIQYVTDTAVACDAERGDFQRVAERRLSLLNLKKAIDEGTDFAKILGKPSKFEEIPLKELLSNSDRYTRHFAIDIVGAKQWHRFSDGEPMSPPDDIDKTLELQSDDSEFRLRLEIGQAELLLMSSSQFPSFMNHTAATEQTKPSVQLTKLKQAEARLERVLSEIDSIAIIRESVPLHPLLHHDSEDLVTLRQYTSYALIMLGRLLSCQASLVDSDQESELLFRRAYREFEKARGGISRNNHAIGSLCDLYSAETTCEHAERFLKTIETVEHRRLVVRKSRSKLESATRYLSGVEYALRGNGRHTVLWRGYAIVKARHDNLLLQTLCCEQLLTPVRSTDTEYSEASSDFWKSGGEIARITRGALKAIFDGLDHTPRSSIRIVGALFEQWHVLMFRAWIAYILAIKHYPDLTRNSSSGEIKDFFVRLWKDANEGVGYAPSDQTTYWKSVFEKHADSILQKIDSLICSPNDSAIPRGRLASSLFSEPTSRQIKDWFNQYHKDWYAL